jgi:hypothetical protein
MVAVSLSAQTLQIIYKTGAGFARKSFICRALIVGILIDKWYNIVAGGSNKANRM